MDWNPLLKYERNFPCFCGSGIKFKKCCMRKLTICIPLDLAAKMKAVTFKDQFQLLLKYYLDIGYAKKPEPIEKQAEVNDG
jgi:hypothetical protein